MDATLPDHRLLAPLDDGRPLAWHAGGNQTQVYLTADRRWVVKAQATDASPRAAIARARAMRAIAEEFAACLGPRHTIASRFIVAPGAAGRARVLIVQPFLAGARPLHDVDYAALPAEERARVASQLDDIARRARRLYRARGYMPDLYGYARATPVEQTGLRLLDGLPRRVARFVRRQSLLRSHNLLLTDAPTRRVVLVDYDLVGRTPLARRAFHALRWLQLSADRLLVKLLHPRDGATVSA